jgi:hypothetical protein
MYFLTSNHKNPTKQTLLAKQDNLSTSFSREEHPESANAVSTALYN